MTRWIPGDHDLHAQHPDLVARADPRGDRAGPFLRMTRLLAIMGSGETAPTMVKPHRQLFDRLGPAPAGRAARHPVRLPGQRRRHLGPGRRVLRGQRRPDRRGRSSCAGSTAPTRCAREAALARLAAGPLGVRRARAARPTPCGQWAGTDVPELLADKLAHGGCVVFASAAALTLGRYTVPVYEIYKVGADPVWADGLDLLGDWLGPDVAVIPHYDNAEGGNHDTRFCYLGERRLAMLEAQLPDDGWVLGVDEHTGCVFDLDAGTATVVGNGVVTVRRARRVGGGRQRRDASDRSAGRPGVREKRARRAPAPARRRRVRPSAAPTALHAEIRRLEAEFDARDGRPRRRRRGASRAGARRHAGGLVGRHHPVRRRRPGPGRRAAHGRPPGRAGPHRRPRPPRGGRRLRRRPAGGAGRRPGQDRRFGDADRVRDALAWLGVEVRDTPEGTEWRGALPTSTRYNVSAAPDRLSWPPVCGGCVLDREGSDLVNNTLLSGVAAVPGRVRPGCCPYNRAGSGITGRQRARPRAVTTGRPLKSTNWSGYSSTGGPFTSVSASWVQPTGQCGAGASYSSFWVGLDGDGTDTVEQTGSDVDCAGGVPDYYTWYEMYPAAPQLRNSGEARDHFTLR